MCNNHTVAKRGQPRYNLTYKYDYIFKTIIHNVNYLTEKVELDATIKGTLFVTASPGEKDAGVAFPVRGKTGELKGGQTVLITDLHRI